MSSSEANKIFLNKEDYLLREHEESQSMFWLQSGQLAVYKMKGAEKILLGHVYSGELVGEMSFLDSCPRSASVVALSDCEVIEIPQENFQKVFKSQPKWMQTLVLTLIDRLRKANNRLKI